MTRVEIDGDVYVTSCRDPGHPRSPAPQPAHLRHRPLQPALPVLHARGGVRLAAPRRHPLASRRSASWSTCSPRSGVDKVRLTGGEPLLRARLAGWWRCSPRKPRLARPRDDHQRRAARRARRGAPTRPGSHRVTVSLDTLRPERFGRSPRRDTHARVLEGIEAVGRRGFAGAQARHRGDPRRERRRAGRPGRVRRRASAPRCASSSTWTSAAPPAGAWSRWFRAPRCSTRLTRALRPRSSRSREEAPRPPSASACPTAPSFGIISSTTAALLPRLRPEPPHRRRHVVPLPLRARGHRPARAAARRGLARASSAR